MSLLRSLRLAVAVLLCAGVVSAVVVDDGRDEDRLSAGGGGDRSGGRSGAGSSSSSTTTVVGDLGAVAWSMSSTTSPGGVGSAGGGGGGGVAPGGGGSASPTTSAGGATGSSSRRCSSTSSIDQRGLWVVGHDRAAQLVSGGSVDAFAWAPDADQLAWLSGGGSVLRVAAAVRTGQASVRVLVEGWDLLPVVGWSDLSDAVLVAGMGTDDAMGVWRVPLDGSAPRLLFATEEPPVAFAVGGEGPWGLKDGRYRWVAAVVAGGSVDVVRGDGAPGRTVLSGAAGAYDAVAVDRGGETVAVGGPGGLWVSSAAASSSSSAEPARQVVAGRRLRPLEFGMTSSWVVSRVGDAGGGTLAAVQVSGSGDGERALGHGDLGWALSTRGSEVFVAVGGVGVVEKSLEGAPDRVLEPGDNVAPTASPSAPIAWVARAAGVLCVAGDSRSDSRFGFARFGGGVSLGGSLRMEWTPPNEAFGGHYLSGLVALVAA